MGKATKVTAPWLVGTLGSEIDKLIAGKTTPENLNAIANASGKIVQVVRLQLEASKLSGGKPDLDFIKIEHKED